MTDSEVQQLIVWVGTQAKIDEAKQAGQITDDDFVVVTDAPDLQTELTAQNKLNADYVDDSNSANKFTTTQEKSTWNGKQDAISDLAAIRAGASAGATALQPSALNGYATQLWVGQQGYLTQAVDDGSTTSTTLGWSASKLNGIIGDIESTINAIRGV